jgi:PAS domain S-box-containing protein
MAAGLTVSALGVAVLFAWYLHFIPLIQLSPTLVPMHRLTALGFLLSGLGLVFATTGRKQAAGVSAVVVLIPAVLVCLEYARRTQFGIDEFLGPDYVHVLTSSPGRMSPVTALCFIAFAVALLVASRRRLARFAATIVGILASVLMGVGTVTTLGYLLQHTDLYSWGNFTRMAVHTCVAFAVIGAGLLALTWEQKAVRQGLPGWAPVGIALGLAAGVLGEWHSLTAYDARDMPLLLGIVLGGGLLLVSLLALAVYLAQRAQSRSRELQEAKTELERLFEGSPDALLVTDRHGRIIRANTRVESSLGYTREELLGEPIERLVPERIRDCHDQYRKSYYSSPSTRPMGKGLDLRARRKDGTELPVDISLSPLQLGSEIQVLAVVHDISERWQAQEALRVSEERFRKVFEEGPIGFALVGPDYRITKVNAALCRMVGYSDAELTGKAFREITYPGDPYVDASLGELLFSGEVPLLKMEKRYVTKNGEIMWANVTASLIRDWEGKPLYRLAMIEDITERRRAEAELRLDSAIFSNMEEGVCLVRMEDSVIVHANPKLERMLGYGSDELTGKPVAAINALTGRRSQEIEERSGPRSSAAAHGAENSCTAAKTASLCGAP